MLPDVNPLIAFCNPPHDGLEKCFGIEDVGIPSISVPLKTSVVVNSMCKLHHPALMQYLQLIFVPCLSVGSEITFSKLLFNPYKCIV